MWVSTVGLVNGKYRYLTAETFGFKINSNGQALKKRQLWTIEPFPENVGPDGSVSSAASVSSQCIGQPLQQQSLDPNEPCILAFGSGGLDTSLTSVKSSSNGSSSSDQDGCGEEHENVAIKSHLNKYLAVDSFGNVTCDSDEKTENARFTISICSMSQGRSKDEHIFWAFRNMERGYYLGTTDDGMICCNAKTPRSRAELWNLHLIPARGASFFALKSLGRKRFARVVEEDNRYQGNQEQQLGNNNMQVQLDSTISWGSKTLFQFKYHDGGRYTLLTSDCMYLTNEGKCINWESPDDTNLPPPECLFTLEYHSGFLAFRDSFSHYLAAAGRSSVLRSRSIGVSRDQLFVFESAPIQVSLKATFNNRWVSIKQGVDVSANQTETTFKYETFQLTYHKQTQNWSIMTHDCNFWTVSHHTSTISVCKPGDYEGFTRGQFKLVWSDSDASCSLKYIDTDRQERWISARKSGQLFLAANATQIPVKFVMRFQNRRLLNLRPVDASGFVGLKGPCGQLEANKTSADSIAIEYPDISESSAFNGFSNGLLVTSKPRAESPEPKNHSNEPNTFNIFNIRLNSTKLSNGSSVIDRFSENANVQIQSQEKDDITVLGSSKEIDCGIDDNNNCTSDEPEAKTNGNVESSSTPSVASIINSFSNAKIGSTTMDPPQKQIQNHTSTRTNSTVFKLASSFGSISSANPTTVGQLQTSQLDTSSSVTSCSSTASASSSVLSNGSLGDQLTTNEKCPLVDQLTQFECCYLKAISTGKYLVVGDKEASVVCDATNKACAQPWILELRSHNSIAIRASDNQAYMQLGTNGTIYLARCEPKAASLWEF